MKFECAFIYVAPGCNPAKERDVVEGDSINMNVVGCATYAEAEEIAKEMVAKGLAPPSSCALASATRVSLASSVPSALALRWAL